MPVATTGDMTASIYIPEFRVDKPRSAGIVMYILQGYVHILQFRDDIRNRKTNLNSVVAKDFSREKLERVKVIDKPGPIGSLLEWWLLINGCVKHGENP